MAMMRRDRFHFPEMVRSLLSADWELGWLHIEEYRDGDALVVRAELPGIDPDKDVEISIDGSTLHIRAEKQETSEHKDKDGYRSEFHYGSFLRELSVPPGTKVEDVTASYNDGILEIRVPIAETVGRTPTKVPITRS